MRRRRKDKIVRPRAGEYAPEIVQGLGVRKRKGGLAAPALKPEDRKVYTAQAVARPREWIVTTKKDLSSLYTHFHPHNAIPKERDPPKPTQNRYPVQPGLLRGFPPDVPGSYDEGSIYGSCGEASKDLVERARHLVQKIDEIQPGSMASLRPSHRHLLQGGELPITADGEIHDVSPPLTGRVRAKAGPVSLDHRALRTARDMSYGQERVYHRGNLATPIQGYQGCRFGRTSHGARTAREYIDHGFRNEMPHARGALSSPILGYQGCSFHRRRRCLTDGNGGQEVPAASYTTTGMYPSS